MGCGYSDQSVGRISSVARGLAAHDEGPMGADHQHYLGGGPIGQSGPDQLRRCQGRGCGYVSGLSPGGCEPWDYGQCGGPGFY